MVDEPTLINASPFPRLAIMAGGQIGQEISLREELSIGRAEDNTLQLSDPRASRHHARIRREGVTFILTDLGSANGTLVDGVRLAAPHVLKKGDRIAIGDTEMLYLEPGQALEDTITVPLAVPAGQPTVQQPAPRPPRVPSPPPLPAASRDTGRGVTIALALVGLVVILAVVGIVLLLLNPDLPAKIGLARPATATVAVPGVAPTEPAEEEIPIPAPLPAQTVLATVESVAPEPILAPQEIEDRLSQAQALVARSKIEDAIVIYESLVEQAPGDARPHAGWAWALIYDDQPDQGLTQAQMAVDLDPGSAAAATVLARAYLENGDKDAALPVAQKAVSADPGSAEAHAVLAEAYLRDGQNQAALDEADLALVQDINSANAHRIRGWVYQLIDNDMGRAAGELQTAAGLQPELWLRRHELGLVLLQAENYNTAIIAFQDALGLRPKAITYTAIGEAYYHLAQYDPAKASLQQALSMGAEDADTYALMAASYAHLERCDEAASYIDQALVRDPVQPLALEARDLCEDAMASPRPTATTGTGEPVVSATNTVPVAATAALSAPTVAPTAAPTATRKPASPPASVGGRIAFAVWNAQTHMYDTYVSKADGSGRHIVVDGMHQPAFSPNGEWLAVNGEKSDHMNLFIVRPDGSGLKKVTDFIEDALPSWSPDSSGFLLATTRDQPKHPQRIYVVDQVPFTGRGVESGRLLSTPAGPVQGDYATWAPDDQVVYHGCDYTVEPQTCGLFRIPVAGGAAQQLTTNGNDTAPAVYGGRIAFTSDRDGNWEVYIMNEDGSGLKRLTNDGANDGLPAWSPDGKTLAFVSNRSGAWAIWAMSPDGSNQRKLFDIGGSGLISDWQHERISWAP